MRITMDTPISELMHYDSDPTGTIRYIDLDEDELVHWKYIKRVKVNGRWRYYYDDSEYRNAANAAHEAEKAMNKAAGEMSVAEKNYKDKVIETRDSNGRLVGASAPTPEAVEAITELANARTRYKEAKKKADEAVRKYKRVSFSTLATETINKGMVAIANFFSDLFSGAKNNRGGTTYTTSTSRRY